MKSRLVGLVCISLAVAVGHWLVPYVPVLGLVALAIVTVAGAAWGGWLLVKGTGIFLMDVTEAYEAWQWAERPFPWGLTLWILFLAWVVLWLLDYTVT